MKVNNQYILETGNTLGDAITKIKLNRVRTVIIVKNNKVIGVISEGDLLKAFMKGANTRNLVDQFINIEFSYLNQKDFEIAKNIIITKNINLLPIVNKDMELIDCITIYDIFDEYLSFDH